MDGTIDAQARMQDLLDRVRHGETLTIIEDGRPVAHVTPAAPPKPQRSEEEVRAFVAQVEAFASRHTLDGISLRELIDEGKR